MAAALDDARSRRADLWRARHDQITQLIGRATPLVQNLGSVTEVELRSTQWAGQGAVDWVGAVVAPAGDP